MKALTKDQINDKLESLGSSLRLVKLLDVRPIKVGGKTKRRFGLFRCSCGSEEEIIVNRATGGSSNKRMCTECGTKSKTMNLKQFSGKSERDKKEFNDWFEMTPSKLRECFEYDGATGAFSSKKMFCSVNKKHHSGYWLIKIILEDVTVNISAGKVIWMIKTGTEIDLHDRRYQVDHINRVRDDYRWDNLRLTSPSENNRNKVEGATNTSGTRGVFWYKQTNKWAVQITVNGVKTHRVLSY